MNVFNIGLGYVNRKQGGCYELGSALFNLTYPAIRKRIIVSMAEEHARSLAERTREAGVVAMYDQCDVFLIAKAEYDHTVMVNTNIFMKYPPYATATGRLLLAHLEESELDRFMAQNGLPGDSWPEVTSRARLNAALARIRTEGIVFKQTGEVQAMAVPVFGPDDRVWAALGLYLPHMRFKGEHKNDIVAELRHAGKRMSFVLSSPDGSSGT